MTRIIEATQKSRILTSSQWDSIYSKACINTESQCGQQTFAKPMRNLKRKKKIFVLKVDRRDILPNPTLARPLVKNYVIWNDILRY